MNLYKHHYMYVCTHVFIFYFIRELNLDISCSLLKTNIYKRSYKFTHELYTALDRR